VLPADRLLIMLMMLPVIPLSQPPHFSRPHNDDGFFEHAEIFLPQGTTIDSYDLKEAAYRRTSCTVTRVPSTIGFPKRIAGSTTMPDASWTIALLYHTSSPAAT